MQGRERSTPRCEWLPPEALPDVVEQAAQEENGTVVDAAHELRQLRER